MEPLEYADRLIKDISPDDDMFAGDGQKWYFEAGKNGLESIVVAIGGRIDQVKNILDLPCGYGRVLRYLVAFFKDANIFACDLNRSAVDFCVKTFGVQGVYSHIDFSRVEFDRKFDLVWCGSLLTHFSERFWDDFLGFITSNLEKNGVVVFTVHGRIAAYLAEQKNDVYGLDERQLESVVSGYRKTGFGYVNYSDDNPHYGISLASPAWVVKKLQSSPDLQIISFREHAWGHHDVYAISKVPPAYIV